MDERGVETKALASRPCCWCGPAAGGFATGGSACRGGEGQITSNTCGEFCKLRIPVFTQMTPWAQQYLMAKIIKINI